MRVLISLPNETTVSFNFDEWVFANIDNGQLVLWSKDAKDPFALDGTKGLPIKVGSRIVKQTTYNANNTAILSCRIEISKGEVKFYTKKKGDSKHQLQWKTNFKMK